MRQITEGLFQVPSEQLFLASGDYEGDYGLFYSGQVVIVPHTVTVPAAAMAALINRDGGSALLAPLPGGCCVPAATPPVNPLYGSTPDGRAHGVEMWCIGDYASDYFTSARDGEFLIRWMITDQSTDMLAVMARDGAVIGPSLCGIGIVTPPVITSDTCADIQLFPLAAATPGTVLVGADCNRYTLLDVVQTGETLTTISFNGGTNILSYVDEDGVTTLIDLSALAGGGPDVNVASVTYNPLTGILTITETDLTTYPINIANNPVTTVNSIVGDGEGAPIQLSGDLLAPGAGRFYGTDGAGVKGWYSISPTITSVGGATTITIGGAASPILSGLLLEDVFGLDLGYLLPL